MSAQHTPGPWRVGITGHAVYQVAKPELRVALCSDLEEKGGRDAERANARLIAAAPELLELLKFAVEKCGDDDEVWLSKSWVKQALAVIAKVEGAK